MNPIVGMFNKIVNQFNAIVDKLDRRQIDLIRQIFFLASFFMIIIAIISGYNMGKEAAHRSGIQLAPTINKTFDIDIKQDRDDARFKKMLEKEVLPEARKKDAPMESYSFESDNSMEVEDSIIEEKRLPDENYSDSVIDKSNLSEIPHTDEKPVENKMKRYDLQKKSTDGELIRDIPLSKDKKNQKKNKTSVSDIKPITNQDIIE